MNKTTNHFIMKNEAISAKGMITKTTSKICWLMSFNYVSSLYSDTGTRITCQWRNKCICKVRG